ncbi:Dolichyl-diphosphooligosaccharide--protein glycosyltransferase 48 kDa subunit [Platanthera guangdongensis]|uniref:Dolichyl-diphosphooligosaccharide--protein glycosyltransferase 48 kDa subunit n=1 Tax=Platanthera guangdongensis TaxID=2320717 RepID=A0ABR2LPY0_9ASPA
MCCYPPDRSTAACVRTAASIDAVDQTIRLPPVRRSLRLSIPSTFPLVDVRCRLLPLLRRTAASIPPTSMDAASTTSTTAVAASMALNRFFHDVDSCFYDVYFSCSSSLHRLLLLLRRSASTILTTPTPILVPVRRSLPDPSRSGPFSSIPTSTKPIVLLCLSANQGRPILSTPATPSSFLSKPVACIDVYPPASLPSASKEPKVRFPSQARCLPRYPFPLPSPDHQPHHSPSTNLQYEKSGNEQFVTEISKWVFHERGHLKAVNMTHHFVGEKTEPAVYRINDDLEYSIEIYEWSGTSWKPYVADDVQVQFYMMSPYVLKTLSTNLMGLYSTSFKVPDVYGVFRFKVEYQRLGYTSVSLSKQATTSSWVKISVMSSNGAATKATIDIAESVMTWNCTVPTNNETNVDVCETVAEETGTVIGSEMLSDGLVSMDGGTCDNRSCTIVEEAG